MFLSLTAIPVGSGDTGKAVQSLKETFEYVVSPQLQSDVFLFKFLFIFLGILCLIGVIYYLITTDWLGLYYGMDMADYDGFKDFGSKKLQKQWTRIKKQLIKTDAVHYKLMMIEAEKFFDNILKRMGYGGETIADRLPQLTQNEISNLDELSSTLQLCEDIARDPDYRLSKEIAEQKIAVIEKALIDIGVF